MPFDQRKYIDEYNQENYDRLVARVPKGKRKLLHDYAVQHGTSINAMIIHALETCYHLDLSKEKENG